jgi:hypothetical protein
MAQPRLRLLLAPDPKIEEAGPKFGVPNGIIRLIPATNGPVASNTIGFGDSIPHPLTAISLARWYNPVHVPH